MQIYSVDNLHKDKFNAVISNPSGFEYLQITEEDSPVMIDSMVSVQNGRLMFVSSVKIGTLAVMALSCLHLALLEDIFYNDIRTIMKSSF